MRLQERPGRRATMVIGLPYPLADRLIAEARQREIAIGDAVAAILAEHWPEPLRVLHGAPVNERGDAPGTRDAASTADGPAADGQGTG